MYTWPFTVLVWYMYINNNNNNKRYHRNRETINTSDPIDCFSVSMISFIIMIIINVHVPDQYSERSCIHVSEVLIVSLFLWYLVWYMYINNNNNNKRYHRNRETINTSDPCIHDRSLYLSGTCTLIIIKIKDIQTSTVNGHVYMC
jgi:hypothetical protein